MIFAIGDVHGCADELRLLLNRLPIAPESTVVFLGDYVDRGPRSAEVIDTVLELSQHCNVVALMGNHEAMFLDYLKDPTSARAGAFIYNGGSATLASYADARGEVNVPEAHLRFLRELRLSYQDESYYFVHAGVPTIPLRRVDERRHRMHMLWMRGRFLTTDYAWDKIVVHGHTPVERAQILPNRINIDTGCVFRRRLTGIALPGERLFSVRRLAVPRRIVLRDADSRRAAVRFRGEVPVRLERQGRTLDLVTVDYSELGMYLRAVDPDAGLEVGEPIAGVVGPDPESLVAFRGVVVRRHKDDAGVHYGVKILESNSAGGGQAAPPGENG